jgi:Na+-transporting methylmalonyl-CoA/oxaloacetate decarboxylase gamma subunit
MSFSESLLVALFCMAVVFAVLAILCLIIRVFSSIVSGLAKKEKNSISSTTPLSEVMTIEKSDNQDNSEIYSSGTLKLQNVDEPTAAMIMAIVSDESGIPLSELCFKSIKLITK